MASHLDFKICEIKLDGKKIKLQTWDTACQERLKTIAGDLVLDNPAQFMSKLEFEITFECIEDLPQDLEWKIIYARLAESEEFDQVLDTVYVGHLLLINLGEKIQISHLNRSW